MEKFKSKDIKRAFRSRNAIKTTVLLRRTNYVFFVW